MGLQNARQILLDSVLSGAQDLLSAKQERVLVKDPTCFPFSHSVFTRCSGLGAVCLQRFLEEVWFPWVDGVGVLKAGPLEGH